MEYTIDEIKNKVFGDVLAVYDVFKNHFGERFTDLQGIPDNDQIVKDLSSHPDISEHDGKYQLSLKSLNYFKHFYSQYYNILVWWPSVIVTNENGKSIVIQDLYAKITININGKIPHECRGFLLNRSTYSMTQFFSNYLHSHCNGIPKYDFTSFISPCLGKGPILDTIDTLKNDNDMAMWMLFCEELSRYVTVESIKGVPYHRLEDVGASYILSGYTDFQEAPKNFYSLLLNYRNLRESPYYLNEEELKALVMDFTKYYLENGHLSMSYIRGKFECGMTYYEYMVDVSNSFIDYYNKKLKSDSAKTKFLYSGGFLIHTIAANGKFREAVNTEFDHISHYQNQLVCVFKGKEIRTRIEEGTNSETTLTTILNWQVAMRVLSGILKIINFRFKNEYPNNRTTGDRTTTEGSGTAAAQTHKTVCCI